jgi:acyl phosphate:glycerol-3-phosphate acyltransferase
MWISVLAIAALAYVVGSIPSGLIVVRIATGKDVRAVGSGRTGGTNAMRAAGVVAGGLTAVLDILKGVASGWIVDLILPGFVWVRVLAAVFALWGSIHSVFLIERDAAGHLHLRGGAGGATGLGGAISLWGPSIFFILPIAAIVFVFIGYASVTTISVAVSAMIIFITRAITAGQPWEFVAYGVLAVCIVLYALRPNIKRLREGTERMVGLRAYNQKRLVTRRPRAGKPNRGKSIA